MLTIEGYSRSEVLSFPTQVLDELLLDGEPVVLRIGSADVLGSFQVRDLALQLELAQVDGGGEGALPTLASIAKELARQRACDRIEWTVHAVHCANPNLKLRRVLERRGFRIETTSAGSAYRLTEYL